MSFPYEVSEVYQRKSSSASREKVRAFEVREDNPIVCFRMNNGDIIEVKPSRQGGVHVRKVGMGPSEPLTVYPLHSDGVDLR